MRRAEWLARPWRLVLIVLVVVALPLVALGELVASDSRSRLEQAEQRATGDAAARASELVASRLAALTDEVSGVARSDELAVAIDTLDRAVVQRLLATYRNALSRDIERILLVAKLTAGPDAPPTGEIVGRFPSTGDAPSGTDYVPLGRGNFSWARTARVVTHEADPPGVAFSEGVRGVPFSFAPGVPPSIQGTNQGLVAEVPLVRVAGWLTPMLSAARDVHIVDERDRVIASAGPAGAAATLRVVKDLTALAGPGDLFAVADVSNITWRAVAVRAPTAVIAFDEAAALQRALRLALVALLLAAAFVIGSVAAQLQREREDLRAANVRLDAASEAKSRFLAAVSHDLRTPLNAILGFSDVLLQKLFGELNAKQDEYLKDIHSAGEHQLALVNDLLDLSKIEAGKMELHPVVFSLPEVLSQATSVVSPLASAKRLTIDLDTRPGPASVEHDPARLRQVVLNLLSNAIKFTPEGGRITGTAAADAA
ncbi:MAG: HAMP domain-containing sensor histidine kinase, partial [Chloroflexota bacterium]